MDREALIEGYVFGNLNPDDLAKADALRKLDVTFDEAVTALQALRQAIARNEHNDIRQMVKKFEQQKQQASVKSINRSIKWWALAASLLLVFSLAYWLYPTGNQNEKLYASYYKTMPNIVSPIVRGTQQQDTVAMAFTAYEQMNYKKAEFLFSILYSQSKEPYALFYQGMCKLEMNDAKGCISLLESITWVNGRYLLADFSEWYLGLANLKVNKLPAAQKYLEAAAQQGKPYQSQASALLLKLRRTL